MTMINIGGETAAADGGLSANAMAVGGDKNLIFTLTPDFQGSAVSTMGHDGLLTIARRMKLKKSSALTGARVACSSLPTSEVRGSLRLQRGSNTVAQFDYSVPPSGQIPAPTGTAVLAKDEGSTIVKTRTKRLKFAAIRSDASGQTTLGQLSPEIWLGEGTTVITPSFLLDFDSRPGFQNLGSSAGVQITVVPYDKLADKEGAPVTIDLSWSLGPFSVSTPFGPSASAASGNLPAGTVVNLQRVTTYGDGSMSLEGPQVNYTIDSSGGMSFNPGGGGTYLQSGNASVYTQSAVLYKLSTHSSWTLASGNQNFIVSNSFAAGGLSLPGATRTFSSIAYATLLLSMQIPQYGPNFKDRFDLKVFAGGSQVLGSGRTVTGQNTWPYQVSWDIDTGGTNFRTEPRMVISQAYAGEHSNYAPRIPRGDQYYVDGEKNAVDIAIANRFGVTGLKIYVAEASANATTGAISGSWGAWGLIYDGPAVNTFKWQGSIINASPTIPSTNTTASYSLLNGQVSWDSGNAEEILVEPGDQLIFSASQGSFSSGVLPMIQMAMPIEFLD